ncbi:hypothetical protein JJV70_03660 [Streptomyces sp. JJ66]|uniref:hypothetical protein n=1 Tax=Streptomyces sp. JJ66 TaxID=2803843 RepID=UPI001C56605C|nr:hypothetical protein [Streptomyces sp. JJ66]MBW1601214.1 hypothetical protein [Streptomyces sp. JJ66]
MTVTVRRLAAAGLSAALFAGLSGCGSAENEESPEDRAAALINQVNAAMKKTSFHSTGTTTAFADSKQETTYDPKKGLRTVASGSVPGEMYCKDGRNYLSAGLLAASLEQRGQSVDVPEELADVYVYTDTGQDCSALFAIAESGKLAPEKDTEVSGKPATAIEVTAQGTSDTYYVAASGTPYLLRLESERGGQKSTTAFGDFGEPTDVTLPDESDTMPLEEFRKETGQQ